MITRTKIQGRCLVERLGGILGNGVLSPLDEENNPRVTKTTALLMNSLRKIETLTSASSDVILVGANILLVRCAN